MMLGAYLSLLLLTCCQLSSIVVGQQQSSYADNCKIVNVDGVATGICEGNPPSSDPKDSASEQAVDAAVNQLLAVNSGLFEQDNMLTSESATADYEHHPSPNAYEQCHSTSGVSGTATTPGIVSYNCGLYWYWYRPHWVFTLNRWYRVAWLPSSTSFPYRRWYQAFYYRWCKNTYCVGQSGCHYWWRGRCVTRWVWRRIWVYISSTGLRYRWIRVPGGCCCVPWTYYTVMIGK